MLSLGTLSYLTYEGVRFFEELELACRERTVDLKPHLRRMHLVTTAIHEFILTLCTYLDFTHFSQADADKLRKLQAAVSSSLYAYIYTEGVVLQLFSYKNFSRCFYELRFLRKNRCQHFRLFFC